ncbi:MAG: hypothetical protein N2491_00290 [Negativicutes bacterium]|nr:hypothetical protein [Negativicutes bacterium]
MNNTQQNTTTNSVVTSYTQSQSSFKTQTGSGQSQRMQTGGQNQTTVVAVFDSYNGAEQAVNELRRQGFTQEEINIISKKNNEKGGGQRYEDDITDGALTGGTLGGIGGLLVGAGALAIPGVGPIVAAGPIAAALSGAVAGGIAGGLIDWGIPAEAGRRYEAKLAQGSILAIVRTQTAKVGQAASIFKQNGANDVATHT